jgi:hypothetical protein
MTLSVIVIGRIEPKFSEKTWTNTTLSTTNPTRTNLEFIPDFRVLKQVTKHMASVNISRCYRGSDDGV